MDQLILSVERIDKYCQLKEEPPLSLPGDAAITDTWPSAGSIEFKNVKMRYNELNDDFILKGLDFVIKGGERIGCVGRTGAGKSSLIQVLFRMVECTDDSLIAIDGIDIRTVGLHLLRGRIAIIPQTAFIFVGTVQYNLDPLG